LVVGESRARFGKDGGGTWRCRRSGPIGFVNECGKLRCRLGQNCWLRHQSLGRSCTGKRRALLQRGLADDRRTERRRFILLD
jgi:hypothetical protein